MKGFDSKEFLKELSQDLVVSFDRAARATTPGLIGSAKENVVRKRLENALPSGVGVGTGCVIDHKGNASKQQDVFLYEKDICPKFSLNDTPETTYYPCEGVIAVGEIKSSIGNAELKDSFEKIESVKRLKRLAVQSGSILPGELSVSYRSYLSRAAFACSMADQYDQERIVVDQIWGFILCGHFSVKPETICKHLASQMDTSRKSFAPNMIASLNNGLFVPYNSKTNTTNIALSEGTGYVYGKSQHGNFEYLLTRLYQVIRMGRTVEVSAFESYLMHEPHRMLFSVEEVIDL
jgi:hypothetical protein